MALAAYLARRIGSALVVAFLAYSAVFFFLRLAPGNPALFVLGEGATPEAVAAIESKLGLDRPLISQYAASLRSLIMFDFGESLVDGENIGRLLASRVPRTVELLLYALLMSCVIGIPLAVVSAAHESTVLGSAVSVLAVTGLSAPNFVIGVILVLVFGLRLRWFPVFGYVSLSSGAWEHFRHLTLPVVTLGLPLAAMLARMVRSSLLETLGKDYITVARAKGASERRVLYRHALRNALVEGVAFLAARTAGLLGGTVVVERVFAWPGLSSFLVRAVSQRDYPAIEAIMVVIALLVVALSFASDVILVTIDPRIRQ